MSKQTKVKYYTPKTKVEKKVITDTRDVPKKMTAKADKNGIIQVQLHREAAIEKLSTNIYTDPKAGIREYINNEARPCREAIKLGHNASIHITVKGNDRTIIIEGIGSMGMTMDMFTEVYTILGLSGNLDEHESGQFGFGRASYLCLSDTMVLETYSRETGERFGFIGRNGTSYEPLPDSWLTIKQYGTKVTFTVRKKVDMHKLVTYIKDISRFLRVPVTLEMTETLMEIEIYDYRRDQTHVKGITTLGPVSFKDYLAGETNQTSDNLEFIEIDNEDYYFVGILRDSGWSPDCVTRLIGMPIGISQQFPFNGFDKWCLDIRNERKYMPTASRDSLTTEATEKLYDNISKDLVNHFSKVHVDSISDYHDSDCKRLVMIAHTYDDWGFDYETVSFSKLLTREFEIVYNCGVLDDEHKHWRRQKTFVILLDMELNIYYTHNVNKRQATLLSISDPNSLVIKPAYSDKSEYNSCIVLLQSYGIQSMTEYLKQNKLKVVSDKDTEITLHHCGKRRETEILKIVDLNENCIMVPAGKKLHSVIDELRDESFEHMLFFKDRKGLVENNSITLKKFCTKAKNSWYNTSDGKLTGRQILKRYKSGIVGFGGSSEFMNTLTLEKCKELSGANITIKYNRIKGSKISNIAKLKLAWKVEYWSTFEYDFNNKHAMEHNMFDVITSQYDDTFRDEQMSDKLGITIGGTWKSDIDEAVKHLSVIKNKYVRELYAVSFNSVFEYRSGWKSRSKSDIKLVKTLHTMMVAIDKVSDGASRSKICRDIVNMGTKYSEDELMLLKSEMKGFDDTLKQTSKKHARYIRAEVEKGIGKAALNTLLNICSDIENVSERLNETLRIAMKDTIRGDVTAVVNEKIETVTMTLDNQPIVLDTRSLLFKVITHVGDWHYKVIDSVSVTPDGKMIIVLRRQ